MRIGSADNASPRHIEVLPNDAMSPLFLAVIEATEERCTTPCFEQ